MKQKPHIYNAIFAAVFGGVMGAVMTYLASRGQNLPATFSEYSMNQGIAGLISGIMGGLLGVIIPYIVIPTLRKPSSETAMQ